MIKVYDKSTYLLSCEKCWSYLDVCLMARVDLHHRQSPVPQRKNSYGSTMLYRWEKKETTYLQLSTKVFFHQKKQSQWLCTFMLQTCGQKGGEKVVFPGNKCEKSSCCHGKLISWVVQQNSMFYQKCWFGTHSTECLKVKLKSPAVWSDGNRFLQFEDRTKGSWTL